MEPPALTGLVVKKKINQKTNLYIYIYIYIYIYPHTHVSSFPGLISVAQVNK